MIVSAHKSEPFGGNSLPVHVGSIGGDATRLLLSGDLLLFSPALLLPKKGENGYLRDLN